MKSYLKELKTASPIGDGLSLFELVNPITREPQIFHIVQSENYLYVGSVSNCGFLYSAHMERDNDHPLDWNLQGLYDAIETLLYDSEEISGELI